MLSTILPWKKEEAGTNLKTRKSRVTRHLVLILLHSALLLELVSSYKSYTKELHLIPFFPAGGSLSKLSFHRYQNKTACRIIGNERQSPTCAPGPISKFCYDVSQTSDSRRTPCAPPPLFLPTEASLYPQPLLQFLYIYLVLHLPHCTVSQTQMLSRAQAGHINEQS